jgi:hypothetical protein
MLLLCAALWVDFGAFVVLLTQLILRMAVMSSKARPMQFRQFLVTTHGLGGKIRWTGLLISRRSLQ